MAEVSLIRASTQKSMKAVLAIINTYSNLMSRKTLYQLGESQYYLVCSEEGESVGIVGYRPLNGWTVEQVNTVILPEYRGKGYGCAASTKMLDILKESYGKVFCTVNTNNSRMLNIKKRQGFVVEGRLREHFGPRSDIFILAYFKKEV